jgi:hypothetical protein
MRLKFIETADFTARWKRLGLDDEALQALQNILLVNPQRGRVMAGTNGMRKIRFVPESEGRGKSGAYRVCYASFSAFGRCYLVTAIAKNEDSNISKSERNEIAEWLRRIEHQLRQGKE